MNGRNYLFVFLKKKYLILKSIFQILELTKRGFFLKVFGISRSISSSQKYDRRSTTIGYKCKILIYLCEALGKIISLDDIKLDIKK
jgi:hypothetical protein